MLNFDDFISYIIKISNMSHPCRIFVFPPFPSLPFLARWRLFGSRGPGGCSPGCQRWWPWWPRGDGDQGGQARTIQGSFIPLSTRFYTSQVVQDFFHQHFSVRGFECRFEKTSASQCCHFKTGQFNSILTFLTSSPSPMATQHSTVGFEVFTGLS